MKRVAVLQSNYLPWKGYFDIIDQVDVFVFYDDVQYTKNDWRNRNLIQTSQGVKWLTIPVQASLSQRICDVTLTNCRWQRKHWATIQQAYSKTPFFSEYADWFEDFYHRSEWRSLSDANQTLIRFLADSCIGIKTQFLDSRDFDLSGQKGDRLLDLLEQLNATHYLSGPSGKSYLSETQFRGAGIDIEYVDYSHYQEYDSVYRPFKHEVSIIDLLFAVGPDSLEYIRPREQAASKR